MILQQTLNANNVYNVTNSALITNKNGTLNMIDGNGNTQKNKVDNSYEFHEKLQKNYELLLMLHKLHEVQQSVWGKFFQFQKSKFFIQFESKNTFKQVFRLRIDDIIYILLLAIICVVFALLPSENTKNSVIGSLLVKAYRYMLFFMVVASMIWLFSTNKYKHWVFLMLCVVFPVIVLLTYMGIIPFDQIDTSTSIFYYLHFLSLWAVYIALYLVYPLKQFIRNKIGSLYSYLFSLSTLSLLLIWPCYSLIQQFSVNLQITFNFITQNKALIITFLIIIIFSFHLLTHNTFFQGNINETKRLLLIDYTKGQLNEALQEIEYQQLQATLNNQQSRLYRNSYYNNQNLTMYNANSQGRKIKMPKLSPISLFLYRNFTSYSRIMSLIVFVFTAAIEIYVFIYLSENLTNIFRSIGVMIFCVGFLVYGCIMNLLPVSRQSILYFFSVLSLVPAGFSFLYCSNCNQSAFTFYQYIFLATALPYTTIYWCVVRSLSKRKPFLKTNAVVLMYIFAHIPLTIFMINNLEMLTTDATTVTIINLVCLGLVGFVSACGLIGFIVFLWVSIKQLPKQQQDVSDKLLDYNYFEEGDPMYIPYQKKQSFSLTWLSSLDIRNLAELFNCIAFITLQLATMYIFNQLNTTYSQSTFIFSTTRYIIISQFFITFIYFSYAEIYVIFSKKNEMTIFILLALSIIGIAFVVLSYTYQGQMYYFFRVSGAASLAIFVVGIGLHVVKNNNKQIINFLSGVLVILIWIFLIIPYAIALPIGSIYISLDVYGEFIYAAILGTTLLIIILVSVLSIVFNTLMNKFEEDKKAKFMIEDVEIYLLQQGVQTEDQILHIFYESYANRDKRYVFFMRRGYPIRLFKQQIDDEQNYKTVVYNHENLTHKASLKQIKQENENKDYCWLCLTCLCGVDQQELEEKTAKIRKQNMINQEQMEQLVPEKFFRNVFARIVRPDNKEKYVDLSTSYSSKSIILKHLTKKSRHLGQQYAILKTKKSKHLANEIWHLIFNFLANQDDYPPAKIIFNDFLAFCNIIDIPEQAKNDINQIFLDFLTTLWKSNTALDIGNFAVGIQELTRRKYQNLPLHEQNKYRFLIQAVYPFLCDYGEFQDVMNQRKINATKLNNKDRKLNTQYQEDLKLDQYSSTKAGSSLSKYSGKNMSITNVHSLPMEQLQNSPFLTSFQRYQQVSQKLQNKRQKLLSKRAQLQYNKVIQPARQEALQDRSKKEQVKIKQKSCKRTIYEKYESCKACCRKIEQEQVVIKRKNIKPWDYLAVESIRILQKKQSEWKQQKKQKQYQFRLIVNNILMALFKLADLYTFMEITIMNPVNGWQSVKQFGILIIQYRVQLYISFGIVLICSGLGIKGIQYIFQDRLGLTETRIPAVFPHPMFFFTFFYKLLILSFFNVITMTLLSTFMCDWTTSNNNVYSMILDSTNEPLQCFSSEHNIYMICSIVALLIYYPLSAYTMPNFQFSQKRLDLKYKPSYLIIFSQVNFVMSAGKVLIAQLVSKTSQHPSQIQILFQSINIFCLTLLSLSIVMIKPCLILWFNVVQFLIVWIGLIWNVLGLVLYMTQQWMICVVVGSVVSAASIACAIVFIRRRFFSGFKVQDEIKQVDLNELQLGWKYKKEYNVDLIRFNTVNKDRNDNKKEIEGDQKYNEILYNNNKDMSNNNKNRNIGDGGKDNVNVDAKTAGSVKNIKAPVQQFDDSQLN